ncbi:hypothetical protein [Mucilaginibacter sp.]|uniref:hypothetical protein n=1 Tax=Mucilaginibacter sp. TaxID=1882438 RepID=UPI0035BC037A
MTEQEEEEHIAMYFNAGYEMQKTEPDLLSKILSNNNRQSDAAKAMANGSQQFEVDKITKEQERIKERQIQRKRGR